MPHRTASQFKLPNKEEIQPRGSLLLPVKHQPTSQGHGSDLRPWIAAVSPVRYNQTGGTDTDGHGGPCSRHLKAPKLYQTRYRQLGWVLPLFQGGPFSRVLFSLAPKNDVSLRRNPFGCRCGSFFEARHPFVRKKESQKEDLQFGESPKSSATHLLGH